MGAIVARKFGVATARQQAITSLAGNLAASFLLTLGVWFLVRRFMGAYSRPLTLAEILLCGGLLVIASGLISLDSLDSEMSSFRLARRWSRIVTMVSVGCFGGALSLTGTSYVSLGCFWILLAIAVYLPAVGLRHRSGLAGLGSVRNQRTRTMPVRARDDLALLGSTAEVAETARSGKDNLNNQITQQMTRETVEADGERVRGVLSVAFHPGEQLAVAHVGFCPPLSRVPRIEVTQVDGPLATVNPSQVLPYGVGFDVRLRNSTPAAETVRIAFTAMT